MRKIVFSVLALSFLSAAVSACSPSMVPFTDWQQSRIHPDISVENHETRH